jgi:hypothetical protein
VGVGGLALAGERSRGDSPIEPVRKGVGHGPRHCAPISSS